MTSPRRFTEPKLVLASHNKGKLVEFQRLFAPFGVALIGAGDLGLAEPAETGTTFIENALIKARAAVAASGLPALADDSGLAVTALGGAPGVYSADWAGPGKDFAAAMQRVQDELGSAADRSAAFVAVLVLAWPDGHYETAEGQVPGRIVWPPRGSGGFGYDPMFQPDGEAETFGEMAVGEAGLARKAALSHRGRAFRALAARCFGGEPVRE
ncbi:MAG: RdgB/HAM1 family non-canonical purine NTP pyrophosphatase [Alphaproteobacteria bacterium]|nr:RdgB/HAM1 family non-canonical purine NTP pyrophosphatase [Alphaproteobacteria bacterium]